MIVEEQEPFQDEKPHDLRGLSVKTGYQKTFCNFKLLMMTEVPGSPFSTRAGVIDRTCQDVTLSDSSQTGIIIAG